MRVLQACLPIVSDGRGWVLVDRPAGVIRGMRRTVTAPPWSKDQSLVRRVASDEPSVLRDFNGNPRARSAVRALLVSQA